MTLKQWTIKVFPISLSRSSCEMAAEITEASVASVDEGSVVFSNSMLRPDSRDEAKEMTAEWVSNSATRDVDVLIKSQQKLRISNAGVEKVLTSPLIKVVLFDDPCFRLLPAAATALSPA